MKYLFLLLIIQLQAFNYIVCLDGGGSKTSLQVLDSDGNPLQLQSRGESAETLFGPSSNFNVVGEEGFRHALDNLFDSLFVDGIPFSRIKEECLVIGGYSGLANVSNEEKAKEIFLDKGFNLEESTLTSDAKLALELVKGNGVILIGGTGSIAFGMQDGQELRAGGFGPLLGDEGGGRSIGIHAIKSALEDELGYGRATVLTKQIKDYYQVKQVIDLIPPIHSGKISHLEIGALVPLVLAAAQEGDTVAKAITIHAANELAHLVSGVLDKMDQSKPVPLILIGGLFLSDYFKQVFRTQLDRDFLDYSNKNVAAEVAKKLLKT